MSGSRRGSCNVPLTLKPEQVKSIAGKLSIKYGYHYFNVREQAVFNQVKPFLNQVSPIKDYFDRFCFTIPLGIYLSFTPGEFDNKYWLDLVWQLATIAHEAHHFTQIKTKPQDGEEWAWDYLKDPYARCMYEAESFAVTMALVYFFTGIIPYTAEQVFDIFIKPNYFVPDDARDLFIAALNGHYEVIRAGAYPFPVVKDVIDWYNS